MSEIPPVWQKDYVEVRAGARRSYLLSGRSSVSLEPNVSSAQVGRADPVDTRPLAADARRSVRGKLGLLTRNFTRDSPLNVALFSGNYSYTVDGPALALNRLVGFLEREGHKVLVFSPTSATPSFEPTGTVISAPSVRLPGRSEYRLSLGLPRSLRARLDAFRPDVFHLATPDPLGLQALRLAKRWGVPAVASFHTRFDTYPRYYGLPVLEKYLAGYMRWFYRQCSQVYVPSPSMEDVLREEGFGEDIRIWSRGVDSSVFKSGRRDTAWRRSLGIGDDEVVVTFVGRLVMEKGLEFLASALDRLTASGVRHRCLVVGDGPGRHSFEKRLPQAHFTGFLTGNELARAYASSDIFVNPSDTETFGNVTLEAMASGLPVVCVDATGSCSLVRHSVTGLLVEQHDVEGLAASLSLLVGDRGLRRQLGSAAVFASRAYDWDVVMSGLVEDYREAVDNSRLSSAPRRLGEALPRPRELAAAAVGKQR